MAGKRNARVELTLDKNRFDRGLDAAGRRMRKFARDGSKSLGDLDKSTASMVGAMAKRIGGPVLRRGLQGVGIAAAIGGGALMSMAGDALSLEKGLARFQIATENSDSKMAEFRNGLSETSRASGINRQELLGGAAAYVALTGDAAGATQGMALFAKVSNATGASMDDIAATAAALKDNLGIDPKDFEAGFSALAVQGKAGAVELRELATLLAGVAPSFAQFKGGGGSAGLVEMGAALQVVRKGFGSSSEAATGLRSMMVSVQRNADKFRKAGVKIYDKDPKTGRKTLRDFSDIVDAIGNSKLAKDPTKLTKAFGSDEAKRAYDQLIQNRALFDDLIAKSNDKNAIDRDAAAYLATPAARVSQAWEAAKLKLAEVFTPDRIALFASALESVVSTMSTMIDQMERAKTIMGGGETRILNGETLGKMAAVRQLGAGAPQGLVFPDKSAFKTDNPGTTTDNSVLSGWEEAGRYAIGRSRDYSLGRVLEFGSSYLDQRRNNEQGRPASMSQPAGWDMQRGSDAVRPIVVQATLQVDGAAIARATANAPAHRTRPGGL